MEGGAATEAATRETVCAAVIERIKTAVRDQNYKPGSRLPSERALAEQLGISRPTLYELMEKLGIKKE